MVRALAPEIAPKRINTVSPGTIDTPMSALEGDERAAHFNRLTEPHLIPRAGMPDEVAKAIVFMVENDFVTVSHYCHGGVDVVTVNLSALQVASGEEYTW